MVAKYESLSLSGGRREAIGDRARTKDRTYGIHAEGWLIVGCQNLSSMKASMQWAVDSSEGWYQISQSM